jgi:hypothetical protein
MAGSDSKYNIRGSEIQVPVLVCSNNKVNIKEYTEFTLEQRIPAFPQRLPSVPTQPILNHHQCYKIPINGVFFTDIRSDTAVSNVTTVLRNLLVPVLHLKSCMQIQLLNLRKYITSPLIGSSIDNTAMIGTDYKQVPYLASAGRSPYSAASRKSKPGMSTLLQILLHSRVS